MRPRARYGAPAGGKVHCDFVMGVPGGMNGTTDALVAAAAASGNTSIDFTDVFCNTEVCFPVISGANVYRDENHLTVTFANTTIFRLRPAIVAALELGRN